MSISVATTVLGVTLAYTGCVLLFQSGTRRYRHIAMRLTEKHLIIAKAAGWVFVLGSLVSFTIPYGVERGVAIWLGSLALSGIASLLVSALTPQCHLGSIFVVASSSAVLAVFFEVIGDFV